MPAIQAATGEDSRTIPADSLFSTFTAAGFLFYFVTDE
jgi:hypothetical protein